MHIRIPPYRAGESEDPDSHVEAKPHPRDIPAHLRKPGPAACRAALRKATQPREEDTDGDR